MGERGRARRAAIGVLARRFPARTGALGVLSALQGALPAGFALAVGALVGAVPVAVGAGFDSPPGRRMVAALVAIAVVLVAQELARVAQHLLANDLYRRFDEYLTGRVMAAALAPPGLELFDDPELAAQLDRAVRVARYGPGELVSGLATKWVLLAEGAASCVLVARTWPLAALGLAAAWLALGAALLASYYHANPFWTDPLRRARYVQRIALMPEWAKEVRVFGLAGWLVERYSERWREVMDELWRSRRADWRLVAPLAAVVLAVNVAVAVTAGRAAAAGSMSLATLAVLMQALFGAAALASQEGDVWIENGAVPVPDALALERALAARATAAGARPVGALASETVRFEGVRFAYPGRETAVLDGLDLEIRGGQSLAVVGLNGAGKTTLVKLLMGLHRPTVGRVTVGGVDLAALDPEGWRRATGAIFQDFARYELPAFDNVVFGAIDRRDDRDALARVRSAADRAGALAFLDALPAGLATPLSRRFAGGVDLSGGQWQRVALARALMAVEGGARVLVLDEPTAQLDVRGEAELFDRFLDVTRGLTSVLISHRFSTVRRADRIVVIEHGRVVEQGTHDALVAAGGRYARLFRLQAERYRDRARG